MACQSNPETYAIVIRLPIEEGAALKSLADSEGVVISAFVAGMIHEKVKGYKLDVADWAWIAKHLEMNLIRRAKADAKTVTGYYKRKRRGRRARLRLKGRGERQQNEQDIDSDRLVENGLHDGCRRRDWSAEFKFWNPAKDRVKVFDRFRL